MRKAILISWPFALALLVFISVRYAVHNPRFVDHYYSTGIYPFIAKILSGVSNLVPFSLWDIFWIFIILLLFAGLVLAIFRKVKWRWYGLRILQSAALLYIFFYFVWGFNYFRPKIETRVSWEKQKPDEAVFRSILDSIISHTNSSYVSVTPADYPAIDQLVEESYKKNSKTLGINYPNGTRRPKTMLFSSFFAKSGVSGYFGPFFNEVHLNYYLLPMEYPFVLAHEKAHQFGITNEAEANLAAFVVCMTSNDHRLQYSGYVNLLVYFLSDASQMKDVKDYIRKIDKPVILDLRFQRSHWQGLRNTTLDKVQTAANNAYLKTNNIEEGVKNYNQVVALVISYYLNSDKTEAKKR
ncbi:MAG TPA: DUF3810 domain-containing protein [Prolixibacteraceae bacterium]|nr:DUF3810 domain-containing protein [Prolixibacteraceae bacterium]